MKKNAEVAAPLKRRSFFGLAMACAAGMVAGPAWFARIVRPSAETLPGKKGMTVSINPLAVPRTRKGANANG